MTSLVKFGKYGATNTTGTSKMGYYVIKSVSEAYTLKYDTTCDGQIISSGELVVKSQYLRFMQEIPIGVGRRKKQQQVIFVPTQTIVHPCLDVVVVNVVHDIPKSIQNIHQEKQSLQRQYICLTGSDNDCILE